MNVITPLLLLICITGFSSIAHAQNIQLYLNGELNDTIISSNLAQAFIAIDALDTSTSDTITIVLEAQSYSSCDTIWNNSMITIGSVVINGTQGTMINCSESDVSIFIDGVDVGELIIRDVVFGDFEGIYSMIHYYTNSNVSNMELYDCSASSVSTSADGSLIGTDSANILLRNVIIENCVSIADSAALASYSSTYDVSVVIEDSSFRTLTCSGGGCALYVNAPGNLYVSNSQFDSNDGSQAIYSLSTNVTIVFSEFTSNTGGAVYASSTNVAVWDSTFNMNSISLHGGAIQCTGTLDIQRSSFYSNSAATGGAIYLPSGSGSAIHSVFNSNSAISGGAIRINNDLSFSFSNCSFASNSVSRFGAAFLLLSGVFAEFSDSHFESNSASKSGAVIFGLTEGQIIIESTSIISNTATENGGVLYLGANTNLEISGSHFKSNSAVIEAGCIYAGDFLTLNVSESHFESNSAGSNGGVLTCFDNCVVDVLGSHFESNSADSEGGAIWSSTESSFVVDSTNFTNNIATVRGGALSLASNTEVNLTNVYLTGSVSNSLGGALFMRSSSNLFMDTVICTDSTASSSSSIVYFTSGTLRIFNSEFARNVAGGDGGIAVVEASTIEIVDSKFEDNSITGITAGECVDLSIIQDSTATISGTTFSGGVNDGRCGSVGATQNSTLSFTNCSFTDYSARVGGISSYGTDIDVTYENCQFSNAAATIEAGVFSLGSGTRLTMNSCSVSGSYSQEEAGVFYVETGPVDMNVYNSTFENNFATENGGVYYCSDTCSVVGSDNIYTSNSAASGGVLFILAADASYDETSSTFQDNHALTVSGGAVNVQGTDAVLTIQNSNFDGNTAIIDGGGIYCGNGLQTEVRNSVFTSHSCGSNGGAIRIGIESSVIIDSVTIEETTAIASGGAIFMGSDCSATVSNISMNYNQAGSGGAIFLGENTDLDISVPVTMIGNVATESGGAIFFVGGVESYSINDIEFTNNSASLWGGAIGGFTSRSSLLVERCTFTNNEAGYGGAISFTEGDVSVYTSTFENNRASLSGGDMCFNCAIDNVTELTSVVDGNTYTPSSLNTRGSISQALGSLELSFGTYENYDGVQAPLMVFDLDSLVVTSSIFSTCSSYQGGAISIQDVTSVSIENCSFESNSASISGGALLIANSQVAISDSTFSRNEAFSNGGAITTIKSVISVENSQFSNNRALIRGAGIDSDHTTLYLVNTEFSNHFGPKIGGCIQVVEGDLSIMSSTFDSCDSNFIGGAIHMKSGEISSSLTIYDTTISNSFSFVGAALALEDDVQINISGTDFTSGFSESGGAIYIDISSTSESSISSSVFTDNIADIGGALNIMNAPGGISMTNCTLRYSTANAGAGGAIYQTGDSLVSCVNCAFSMNQGLRGGAYSATGSDASLTVRMSTFTNNTATEAGGAVYVASNASINLQSSNFTQNTGSLGGALYVDGEITLEDTSRFIMNSAIKSEFCDVNSGLGGGIFFESIDCDSASISESASLFFTENSAEGSGGALQFRQSSECSENYTTVVTAIDNSASEFGSNIASSFSIMDVSPSTLVVKAGESFEVSINVFDAYMNQLKGSQSDVVLNLEINDTDFLRFEGSMSVGASDGLAVITTSLLVDKPSNTDDFDYFGDYQVVISSPDYEVEDVTVAVQLSQCDPGEVLVTSNNGEYYFCGEDYGFETATFTVMIVVVVIEFVIIFVVIFMAAFKLNNLPSKILIYMTIIGGFLMVCGQIMIIYGVSPLSCHLEHSFLHVGFSLVLGLLLVQMYRLDRIFNNPKMKVVKLPDQKLLLFALPLVIVPVVLEIVWALTSAYEVANSSQAECSSPSEAIYEGILFGFHFLVLFIISVLAIKTRKIPKKFNEAKEMAVVVTGTSISSVLIIIVDNQNDLTYRTVRLLIFALWGVNFLISFAVIFKKKYEAVFGDQRSSVASSVMSTVGRHSSSGAQSVDMMGKMGKLFNELQEAEAELFLLRKSRIENSWMLWILEGVDLGAELEFE